jgi:hypothetical protein
MLCLRKMRSWCFALPPVSQKTRLSSNKKHLKGNNVSYCMADVASALILLRDVANEHCKKVKYKTEKTTQC